MNSLFRGGSLAVVAHDAGGAAFVASYLAQEQINPLFVLSGPATQIFRLRLGDIQSISLSEALSACDWMLTGTGWQTDFEWQAIRQCRASGKFVATFLDHWVNYPARFVRNGTKCYPDEIWVGDEYAAKLARKSLPELPIHQIDNPYFRFFVKEVERINASLSFSSCRKNILFVSENINREGLHQNDVIRYFMSNLDLLGVDVAQIMIRSHPSEPVEKYAWAVEEYGENVCLSNGLPLTEEVASSDIVVGCSSMAMALAVMARRRVISCIPDEKIQFTLPFEQIDKLSAIINQSL